MKSSDIDILAKKINPNVLKFTEKNFLDLIVMIAARIYPKEYTKNAKNTVDNLISTFFEPFSRHIEDKDIDLANAIKMPYVHRSLDILISKFVIDYKLTALLNNVIFAVNEIYKNYFLLESLSSRNYSKIVENSQKSLLQFCKDFEILPFMINQEQLVIYFDLIIKTEIKNLTNTELNPKSNERHDNYIIEPKKDSGTVFTLSRFCISLIHFSIFSFSKNNQLNLNNINDAEKFLLFLEKLENSKGFQNFEKKSNRPHTTKLTLIPSKSVLKMINSNLLEAYNFFGDEGNNELNNETHLNKGDFNNTVLNQSQRIFDNDKLLKEYNEKAKNSEEFELRNLLTISDDVFESLINSKLNALKDLFLRYAKLGEKLKSAKINLSSYIKFLRDCAVVTADKQNKISLNTKPPISSYDNKISLTPTKASMKPSQSKSPINSKTALKSKESAININLAKYNINIGKDDINRIAESRKIKNSSFYGPGERKLSDSEVNIIYSVLMGHKHADNTIKIKHNFDKNSGFTINLSDANKFALIDRNNANQGGANVFNGKMDFNMFIKSFELIANKLFPELRLNNSMQKLFTEVIILSLLFYMIFSIVEAMSHY